MGEKICLRVVEPEEGKDSVVAVTAATFPILKGQDAEHLACGACNDVIAWNVSGETAREMFFAAGRLLFLCRCGAHNLVRPQPLRRAVVERALIGPKL
jgi:hypothetical protein